MAKESNNNEVIEKELEEISKEFDVPTSKPNVGETLQKVEAKANADFNKLENKRKRLVDVYRAEEKIPVTVSPFYAPYLSKVVRESVNGIVVEVPANGQTYMINKTHADHIISKIKRIDAMVARQKRAGSITQNFERTPGELHI